MNKDLILREKLTLQRTVLANQSTFLAFLRTAMYFLVAGLTINNLLDLNNGPIIQYVFIGISILLVSIGFWNFRIQNIKITEGEKHIGDYKDEFENGSMKKN
jgi:putative membrane protein